MRTLNEINAQISDWYDQSIITRADIFATSYALGISYFTVHQFAKGIGLNIEVGDKIYNCLKKLVDCNTQGKERGEIMSEDLTQD